jgi:MFS family permease
VLVVIGLFVRLSLEESPVFQEAKAEIAEKKQTESHLPILEVIRTYPKEVLIAMGMRMAENISYYIFTVISITYVTTYLEADRDLILQMLLIGAGMQFLIIPAIGALSDRIGRRPLYLAGAVGVGVWGFVFFGLLEEKTPGSIMAAVLIGLFFHSLMYSPQAAFFSELFGTSVRYTGASVGYQLASIFAGALAPIIALELLGEDITDPNTFAVGVYLAGAAVLTIVAVLFAKETKASSLRHDRVVRGAHD